MDREVRERYIPILKMYRLHVEHLEEYGNVVKVYTNQGPYALKKLRSFGAERSDFMQNIRLMAEKGFTNFAPIYHSQDGNYILTEGDASYYLMPWLESDPGEDNDHYHKMFRSLATLHQKTAREEKIGEERIQKHFDTLSSRWEQERTMLDQFVVSCENKWYMSPFELQYCTCYHHVVRSHEFATKKLEEWHEAMKEKETTRISLIHGNVASNHFLLDHQRNGYFISFEKSQLSTPIQDLVQFYLRSFYTYPMARNDRFEWFQEYQKTFPFTEEEKTLMLAYLAYPKRFTKRISDYMNTSSREDMEEMSAVKYLQKGHWLISNTEFFISQIQAAQAQQNQQSQ